MQKLLRLGEELDKQVVGQKEATRVVAEAIQTVLRRENYPNPGTYSRNGDQGNSTRS